MPKNIRTTGLTFMISGSIKPGVVVILSLMFASVTHAASKQLTTPEETLAGILAEFAVAQSSSTNFIEEKHLSTHKKPVLLKGHMLYKRPGYLKKQIDEPYAETLEIDGDYLSLTSYDGESRQMSVKDNPEVYLYVSAFRGILSGDMTLLEKNFSISYAGGLGDWKVGLVPLQKASAAGLQRVTFEGSNAVINKIVIVNKDDKSILHLHARK